MSGTGQRSTPSRLTSAYLSEKAAQKSRRGPTVGFRCSCGDIIHYLVFESACWRNWACGGVEHESHESQPPASALRYWWARTSFFASRTIASVIYGLAFKGKKTATHEKITPTLRRQKTLRGAVAPRLECRRKPFRPTPNKDARPRHRVSHFSTANFLQVTSGNLWQRGFFFF